MTHPARTLDEEQGRAEQLTLIEAKPLTPEIDFYLGTSFTVMQLEDDLHELEGHIRDLRKAHADKRAVSMKLCADDVAKKAFQMAALAGHLAGVTVVHVNRQQRNGSST